MRATETLRQEHEVILKVLDCLEQLAGRMHSGEDADWASAKEALDFFRCFADRCHHAKEEDRLFPALEAKGMPKQAGPIAVMLSEHVQGRDAVARMSQSVDEAEAGAPGAAERFAQYAGTYVTLLREHIQKENMVLFPMADQMLAGEQQQLQQEFQRAEMDLGAHVHAQYLRLAQDLCERLGIAWEPELGAATESCAHETERV